MQFVPVFTLAVLGVSLCSATAPSRPSSLDVYSRSINAMGGSVVNPGAYPATVAGFQEYLKASGVHAVSGVELTTPNHEEVAARYGFRNFLPPKNWWSRGAALALVVQAIESRTSTAVHVRNWWRPAAYNADRAIGGAKNGDHPTANAVDLDYASVADRMQAERFLRGLNSRYPWMHLSLGLGAETTHVGLGSPRGHREWHYAGWSPAVRRGTITGD